MGRLVAYFRNHLEPSEWWGAILFGLIMAMIFTVGGRSIVADGRDATRDMLMGVVGCNVAWGIIQAWMFVLDAMFERSRIAQLIVEVKQATDEGEAVAAIADELGSTLDPVTSAEERARLYRHILSNVKSVEPPRTRPTRHDLAGASPSACW